MKKKLIPLIILAVAILTMITIDTMGQSWCKPARPPKKNEYLKKYHKMQNELSWDNRHKRRLEFLKEQEKQAKQDLKIARREEKLQAKLEQYEGSN